MTSDSSPSHPPKAVLDAHTHREGIEMNTDNAPMDEGDIAIMLGTQLIQTILNSAPFDEIKDLVKKTGAPVWYQD
jgi:hypothetical protein